VNRLAFMLADAKAAVLVAHADLVGASARLMARIVRFDADAAAHRHHPSTALVTTLARSTPLRHLHVGVDGHPEGRCSHDAGLVNHMRWMRRVSAR